MTLAQAFAGQGGIILIPSILVMFIAGMSRLGEMNPPGWTDKALRLGVVGTVLSAALFSLSIWSAVR